MLNKILIVLVVYKSQFISNDGKDHEKSKC